MVSARTGVWTALLAGAGCLLQSQYKLVARYLDSISTAVVVLIAAWYLHRVATFRPSGGSTASPEREEARDG